MSKLNILILLPLIIVGCAGGEYVEVKTADSATIDIYNDSVMNLTLRVYPKDCTQFDNSQILLIPENLRAVPRSDYTMGKGKGPLSMNISPSKKFTLLFYGIGGGPYSYRECELFTAFTPQKNNRYEYHFISDRSSCGVEMHELLYDTGGNKVRKDVVDFEPHKSNKGFVGSTCKLD